MNDAEYDRVLGNAIDRVYRASIVKAAQRLL